MAALALILTIGLNGEGLLIPWDVEIGHHPRVNYSVLVKVDADPRLVLIEKDADQ